MRWWQLASSVIFGLVVVAVVALAILNANRPDIRPRPIPAQPTAGPKPAAELISTTFVPTPRLPTPTATPRPAPTPTPEPPSRYARVFNTGGIGVNIRRDPGPQGQPIVAVPENTILRLVGPEETVQARLWQLSEHQARGVQGWVPAEFLQPTEVVPTPGRR